MWGPRAAAPLSQNSEGRTPKEERPLTGEHRIITDAAVRRFQCQRAYLRANAALRWVNGRNTILRGQRPNASHMAALQQLDATLRNVRRIAELSPLNIYPKTTVGLGLMYVSTGAHCHDRCVRRGYLASSRCSKGQMAQRGPFARTNAIHPHVQTVSPRLRKRSSRSPSHVTQCTLRPASALYELQPHLSTDTLR
jgi:hypothetical protein